MITQKSIDFHGIVTLDEAILEDLKRFLDDREASLASVIFYALHPPSPLLQPVSPVETSLDDVIQKAEKQLQEASGQSVYSGEWRSPVSLINQDLWGYVELLEGGAVELFQQLNQVGFEHWKPELFAVVKAIKCVLEEKLKRLKAFLPQIERVLQKFRTNCEKGSEWGTFFKTLLPFRLLDKALASNLVKTEKFLGFRYQTFLHSAEQYRYLWDSTEPSTQKFRSYLVLNAFEEKLQNHYIGLYRWLRAWELNRSAKALPDRELVRSIRCLQSPVKMVQFFSEYEKALREALFKRSRQIKQNPHSLLDIIGKIQHQHAVQGQTAEVHTLGVTIRKYQDFLLRTDPNPYIRSRLGFGEWTVGPEPAIAKSAKQLIYKIEYLDELCISLMKTFEHGDLPLEQVNALKRRVQNSLHEMAQPLASYGLMLSKGKAFVEAISELNELGSSREEVVNFIGESLSKALRSDWKFHVLHEISRFHEVFAIHQGVVGLVEDRSHLNRMVRFKKLTQKILEWVKQQTSHQHIHEIEFDISDLRGYLQDLLAYIQRLAKEAKAVEMPLNPKVVKDLRCQLMEYRYLFGEFFHALRRDKQEERVLRNQFLFVDQYFESIEAILQDC